MRLGKKKKRMMSYLLSVCLLTGLCGCGGIWAETVPQADPQPVLDAAEEISYQLLSQAQLDYQVPEQYPGVWVSLGGYDSKGSKEVCFYGRSLPDTFRIMDAATGQCLYTGWLEEKRYNKETGEYNSYGEFTDFTDVGEYYIECDVIGRSYCFVIQEGLLQEQFDRALTRIRQQGQEIRPECETEDVRRLLQQVILVLLSYELYPNVYEDGDGNQIPDILEYMTETVGRIALLQQSADSDELAYERIAALAKYSYLYQKYDTQYATEIIQLAAGLWQQAENAADSRKQQAENAADSRGQQAENAADSRGQQAENAADSREQEEPPDEDARLLAAAELYRATGQRKYVAQVEAAKGGLADRAQQNNFSRYDYLAAVTYIATKQKVNVDLCNRLIRVVMNRAEEIAEGIPRLSYREVDAGEEAIDSMMWDMAVLSVVEYVITNYEYGNLIESQYYFLWGRNAKSHCFCEQEIHGHPAWMACYLMMLCGMRTNG